ncbi:MAG: germination protein YpeB [Clostridia bacterium]|nr:germination protein YpeB [Clostridia bacterium]
MYIRKTALWRIVIFTLAALACTTAFALINRSKLESYRQSCDLANRRAFSQLCEAMASIDSELARVYPATQSPAQLLRISNEICRHSESAKTALAALPTQNEGLGRASGFLSLTADYCTAMAEKAVSGAELTQEEINGLALLHQSSKNLSNELNGLFLRSGGERFFETIEAGKEEIEECFSSGMAFAEENMPESPVLLYDGPYSSHITEQTAAFLEKADADISVVDGIRIAADFLGLNETDVKYLCRTDSDITTFTYTDHAETSFVSLTTRGGNVITFSQNTEVADTTLSGERATELGAAFLETAGYSGMVPSYWYTANGICYVNYHACENGAVIYPDLIQLGIRLDNGAVSYMNAYGYLWNNRDGRELSPKVSAEEAAAAVSCEEKEYKGLCIIPSRGNSELLCHEFICAGEEGDTFLIYINAESLETEKIFVLVKNELGTLTV